MNKYICSVRQGPEMCRTNGETGLQLQVNVYPIPGHPDILRLAELISDTIDAFEGKNEST